METTKIYVIVFQRTNWRGFAHRENLGFYLVKADAEYKLWSLQKKTSQSERSDFSVDSKHEYFIEELSAFSQEEKGKEYKIFAEGKAKEINNEMIQIVNSSMSNLEKMSVLSKEFDYYKSILK